MPQVMGIYSEEEFTSFTVLFRCWSL